MFGKVGKTRFVRVFGSVWQAHAGAAVFAALYLSIMGNPAPGRGHRRR